MNKVHEVLKNKLNIKKELIGGAKTISDETPPVFVEIIPTYKNDDSQIHKKSKTYISKSLLQKLKG